MKGDVDVWRDCEAGNEGGAYCPLCVFDGSDSVFVGGRRFACWCGILGMGVGTEGSHPGVIKGSSYSTLKRYGMQCVTVTYRHPVVSMRVQEMF